MQPVGLPLVGSESVVSDGMRKKTTGHRMEDEDLQIGCACFSKRLRRKGVVSLTAMRSTWDVPTAQKSWRNFLQRYRRA